jgi:hypothetical protein
VKEDIQDERVELNTPKKKLDIKNFIFPIVAVLTLLGIAGFYYFGIYKVKPQSLKNIFSFNQDYITSDAPTGTFKHILPLLSKPTEPRTEESPLNGLLFTKSEMDKMLVRRAFLL